MPDLAYEARIRIAGRGGFDMWAEPDEIGPGWKIYRRNIHRVGADCVAEAEDEAHVARMFTGVLFEEMGRFIK